MPFLVTSDNATAPRNPCDKCGGKSWWKTSRSSPFWRCSTCQPPDKARENRRPLHDIQRATVREP